MARWGKTHGKSKTSDFRRWTSIINRCYCITSRDYPLYGGRGITVCDRWRFGEGGKSALECYLEDMGPRPFGMQTERMDNDGPYSPENCRWATPTEQCRNKRNNRLVMAWGERMPLVQALERAGIRKQSYYKRRRNGMTPTEAIETPMTRPCALVQVKGRPRLCLRGR